MRLGWSWGSERRHCCLYAMVSRGTANKSGDEMHCGSKPLFLVLPVVLWNYTVNSPMPLTSGRLGITIFRRSWLYSSFAPDNCICERHRPPGPTGLVSNLATTSFIPSTDEAALVHVSASCDAEIGRALWQSGEGFSPCKDIHLHLILVSIS